MARPVQISKQLRYRDIALWGLFMLLLLFALTVNLESTPPVWWDEGWTLTVARTWVERGYYARLLDGQIAPPGLEAAFPTTAIVALSFRLLGVGLWQGRLVVVVFTLGAFALIYYLASRLYNRRIALGTLFALVFVTMITGENPLYVGRQVLAEPPMLFFLLAGYACLLWALEKSLWYLPLAIFFWGLGVDTKAQPLPFWLISLAIPILVLIRFRRWATALLLGGAIFGSIAVWRLLLGLPVAMLGPRYISATQLKEMFETFAAVLVPANRLLALGIVLKYGFPTLMGLAYAAYRLKDEIRQPGIDFDLSLIKLALFAFAASWFGWFLFLANGGMGRYLFPPAFVGSVFVASLLDDGTDGFDLQSTTRRSVELLRGLKVNRRSLSALLVVAMLALAVPITLMTYYLLYSNSDTSAQQLSEYLNTQTPPDALIETYDSELFFFLNRPYHYPPDQTHVDATRHLVLDPSVSVDYDPLQVHPDYVVVGSFSRGSHVYDQALATGSFKLVKRFGDYELYERAK